MGDVVKTEETQNTIRENSQTGNNQQQPGEKQDSNKSRFTGIGINDRTGTQTALIERK